MPDYRGLFDREYIGAWDLGGKDATLKITKCQGIELTVQGGKKNKKPVVWFEGREKGMVLNKTNAKAIAAMYGNDTAGWIGKSITIFPTMTSFGSDTVECIRVRPGQPKAA